MLRWSPTIEAGHLLQALTIAGGIGMAGLTAYLTVIRLDSATQIDIALLRQRVDEDEKTIVGMKEDQKKFSELISTNLDKLSNQLVDLRVLVASGGRDGKK